MNAHVPHYIELGNHARSYCGQNARKYDAIASAAHDVAGIVACHGDVWGKLRPDQFQALADFVDYVRSEESIPLSRERIVTDEQSALPKFPHVLEPVQE